MRKRIKLKNKMFYDKVQFRGGGEKNKFKTKFGRFEETVVL